MRAIGAGEAKHRFAELLDMIEQGEEVLITRGGREVARLVPAHPATDRAAAHRAVQRLRARAQQQTSEPFDWAEWKAYRDDARR